MLILDCFILAISIIVKFADKIEIEIRQAQLIANGTSSDSITFTSNSLSPVAGIYYGVYLNGGNLTSSIRYCSFYYAATGLNDITSDTLTVSNCYFSQNTIGLQCTSGYVQVDSCNFIRNTSNGLILNGAFNAEMSQCNFLYNGQVALVAQSGLVMSSCNLLHNGTGIALNTINLLITNCSFSFNNIGMTFSSITCLKDCYSNTYVKNCIFDSDSIAVSQIGWILFDSCMVSHNQTGFYQVGPLCTIRNCIIDSNLFTGSFYNDSLVNCTVKYNGAGISMFAGELVGNDIEYNKGVNIACQGVIIEGNIIKYGSVGIDNTDASAPMTITKNVIENNGIGVIIKSSATTMTCNRICSDSTYDLKYYASSNINVSDNYWCTNDSASIRAKIYDGYVNVSYGIVTFMPLDTNQCYGPTGIPIYEAQTLSFSIFPNPATDYLTVELPENNSKSEIKLFNMLGELVYASRVIKQKTNIDISTFASGVYIIQIVTGNNISRQKFIRQ
jgi:hypothetical protein